MFCFSKYLATDLQMTELKMLSCRYFLDVKITVPDDYHASAVRWVKIVFSMMH